MDFLWNQASSEQEGRQKGGFGAIRLDHGKLLLTREIVSAILASPGCLFGELSTFWTLLADDSSSAGGTYLCLIRDVAATFRTLLHIIAARRSGQRSEPAADEVRFVSKRIGWLPFAAPFGSAFIGHNLTSRVRDSTPFLYTNIRVNASVSE